MTIKSLSQTSRTPEDWSKDLQWKATSRDNNLLTAGPSSHVLSLEEIFQATQDAVQNRLEYKFDVGEGTLRWAPSLFPFCTLIQIKYYRAVPEVIIKIEEQYQLARSMLSNLEKIYENERTARVKASTIPDDWTIVEVITAIWNKITFFFWTHLYDQNAAIQALKATIPADKTQWLQLAEEDIKQDILKQMRSHVKPQVTNIHDSGLSPAEEEDLTLQLCEKWIAANPITEDQVPKTDPRVQVRHLTKIWTVIQQNLGPRPAQAHAS